MKTFIKKSLGIFSLTSCEGCQFELLSHYDLFNSLLKFYDIKTFRLGQEENNIYNIDVALIEGSPEGEEQIKLIRQLRRCSKTIVAIGSCAVAGGIQSARNHLPKKLTNKENVKSLSDYIKINYYIPGCPIRQSELVDCLLDIYFDRIFTLPHYSVCSECKSNENDCHLKNNRPCLGPITRGGCNSVCTNNGEACFGCRGLLENANILKMKEVLLPLLGEEELRNWLTIYGDLEK